MSVEDDLRVSVSDWIDRVVLRGGEFTINRDANGFVTLRYVENGETLWAQNSPPEWNTVDVVTVFEDGLRFVRGAA